MSPILLRTKLFKGDGPVKDRLTDVENSSSVVLLDWDYGRPVEPETNRFSKNHCEMRERYTKLLLSSTQY